MNDFKDIEEYKSYLNSLSLRELKGIAQATDKRAYPDRYNLLCEIIKAKDKTFAASVYQESPKKEFPAGVALVRNIHVALIILFVVLTPIGILVELDTLNKLGITQVVLAGLISLFIIIGINGKKEWVVLLVLISSYLRLLTSLAFVLSNKQKGTVIVLDLTANFLAMVFACYQIYVFSKRETKDYFKEKGQAII